MKVLNKLSIPACHNCEVRLNHETPVYIIAGNYYCEKCRPYLK